MFATSKSMVLTEATGDADLVVWDGREFRHWHLFS